MNRPDKAAISAAYELVAGRLQGAPSAIFGALALIYRAAASEETGVAAFDPTDPNAVYDAIIELGVRVSILEKHDGQADMTKVRDLCSYLRSPGYASGSSDPEKQGAWLANDLEEAIPGLKRRRA